MYRPIHVCSILLFLLLSVEPIKSKHLIQIKKRKVAPAVEPRERIRQPGLRLGPLSEMVDSIDTCTNPLRREIFHHGQQHELKLCPFQDITLTNVKDQTEMLLGIWKGWEIVDGRYKIMIFDDGDVCGAPDSGRRAQFHLSVDSSNEPNEEELQQFQASGDCDFRAVLVLASDVFELFDWTAPKGQEEDIRSPPSSCDCSTHAQLKNQMVHTMTQLQKTVSQKRSKETQVLQEALEMVELSLLLLKQTVRERHPEFETRVHEKCEYAQDDAEFPKSKGVDFFDDNELDY